MTCGSTDLEFITTQVGNIRYHKDRARFNLLKHTSIVRNQRCERFEPMTHFISRLKMIARVND